jgi:hypothetical protein
VVLRRRGRGGMENVFEAVVADAAGELVVMFDQLLDGWVEVRARLCSERAEDFFQPRPVLPGLFEVLLDRCGETLALNGLVQLRQDVERQPALDPELFAEQLEEEVAGIAQRRRDASAPFFSESVGRETRFAFMSPASRSESAMITSAGFAAPSVGNTLPSAMKRFGTSQAR